MGKRMVPRALCTAAILAGIPVAHAYPTVVQWATEPECRRVMAGQANDPQAGPTLRSLALYWLARCAKRDGARRLATAAQQHLERSAPWTVHWVLTVSGPRQPRPWECTAPDDPHLVEALIEVESGGDPKARSARGARGLMQVLPATALALRPDADWRTCLADRGCNVELGKAYLERMSRHTGGDLLAALYAYNAGPTRALRWQRERSRDPILAIDRVEIDETRRYLRRVLLALWRREGAGNMHSPSLHALAAGQYPRTLPASPHAQEVMPRWSREQTDVGSRLNLDEHTGRRTHEGEKMTIAGQRRCAPRAGNGTQHARGRA